MRKQPAYKTDDPDEREWWLRWQRARDVEGAILLSLSWLAVFAAGAPIGLVTGLGIGSLLLIGMAANSIAGLNNHLANHGRVGGHNG